MNLFETPDIKICGLVTTTEGVVFDLNCLLCGEITDDYIEFIAHINTNHQSNLQEIKDILNRCLQEQPDTEDDTGSDSKIQGAKLFLKQEELCSETKKDQIETESILSEDENDKKHGAMEQLPLFEVVKVLSDQDEDLIFKNNFTDESNLSKGEREQIEFLINLYKQHPILWDIRMMGYTNPKLKNKAYLEISEEMNHQFNCRTTPQAVERIILSLRSQLKRENKSSDEATYNFWFYEMLSFMFVEDAQENKQIEDLIDLYKEHPVLWDSQTHGYKSIPEKHKAYCEIAETMTAKSGHKLTPESIKQKISTLCREFKKELQDMSRTGKETPSLWFFDRLSFISKQKSRKERLSSTKETDYLIDLYKQYPILWDHRMYDTKYAVARNKAFEEMSEAMQEKFKDKLVTTNVRLKITQLRSSFYLELHDMLKSQRSTPRLKVFDQLSFIMLGDMDSINKFDEENDQNLVSSSQVIDISSLLQFQKDKDLNSDFIELYKSMPCLWNKQSPDYENEEQCQKEFNFLIKSIKEKWEIHLSEEEILQKISIMKFLNNIIKFSRKSEGDEDISPNHWYSKRLNFLEKRRSNKRFNQQEKCEFCKEIFFTERKLQTHLYDKHNVNTYICKVCKKIFRNNNLLKLHEKIHVSFADRPFKCQFCDAKFAVKATLTEHERRHTKTFLYQCKICWKKFISKGDVNVHMRMHTGEKPYICHECGKSFRNSSSLAVHRRKHSGNRPYKCTICPMAFFGSYSLCNHMKSHSNVRDNICSVCNKGFKLRKTLLQHMLVHSKEKKYSCEICMKKFAQYGGLSGHMKTHAIAPTQTKNLFDIDLENMQ